MRVGSQRSLVSGVESHFGIDAAFLAAGARSVVSSLWMVDNAAALIFGATLHVRLVEGRSLPDAFDEAVAMLAEARWMTVGPGNAVADALDAACPGWRQEVFDSGEDLSDPFFWASFRLSGLGH